MNGPQFITFIYVKDMDRSIDFYQGNLELQEVLDQGACHIFKINSGAYLGICQDEGPGMEAGKGKIILTLVTEDVDDFYRKLIQAGIDIESEPKINPKFQIYHFFLRDPDGYLIEIQKFLDPRWGESRN